MNVSTPNTRRLETHCRVDVFSSASGVEKSFHEIHRDRRGPIACALQRDMAAAIRRFMERLHKVKDVERQLPIGAMLTA